MLVKIILAMVAFAANSLLCRIALAGIHIDPITFSSVRLLSGAVALLLLLQIGRVKKAPQFNWLNAALLTLYVFTFSVAYVALSTAVGALLLFGTVQLVMTAWGIFRGERLSLLKIVGMGGALAGFALLLLPVADRPPLFTALMMIVSGVAWAIYSIRGKQVTDAAAATAGNFMLSVPVVMIVLALSHNVLFTDMTGVLLGVVSGAVTSGAAYLLWYSLLPLLSPATASTLQLSVPCLATLGGTVLLAEPLDLRIVSATLIILTGIGLVIWTDRTPGR